MEDNGELHGARDEDQGLGVSLEMASVEGCMDSFAEFSRPGLFR